MDLRNCIRCGKLFAYDGVHDLCPVCRNEDENDYQKVKDYLWDNPGATIEIVHKETGVEREVIIKFVREERLIADGLEIDMELRCERCGVPISSGRFCEKCQQELLDGFSIDTKDKTKTKTKKNKDRMYMAKTLKKRK